ncbi:Uncharacterised protein [uncultured archaeon]|nr:Uncharacterised protein [uncultured archaeon]
MGDVMAENLTNWKPQVHREYNGFDYHKHGEHRIGYTIIYFKNSNNYLEEHYGGFNIMDNQAKIWYKDSNNDKIQLIVPVSQCKFSKTLSGRITYYHVIINNNEVRKDMIAKNNENMDDVEYGTGKDEDTQVHIGVKKDDAGIISRLTGKASAIYRKNQSEAKLNEMWKTFDYTIEDIYGQEKEIEQVKVQIPSLQNSAKNNEKEWSESLKSLGNLLNKKTTHEKGMWALTQSAQQNRAMKIKQKFHKSDVDEMNFNSMQDYIKQYPELQSSRDIDKAYQSADNKRETMLRELKAFEEGKAKYNSILHTFEQLTEKAESNITEFEKYIAEAEETVNNSKYNKSSLVSKLRILQTDYEKDATRLNLLPYKGKLQERKVILKRVKDKLSLYERKKWVDVEQ